MRSDSDINDMSKFFQLEGIGYDPWCLPDHRTILSVPKPDRSVGVLHNEVRRRRPFSSTFITAFTARLSSNVHRHV